MEYVLASASPRRQELITLILENFTVDVPENEEVCPKTVLPLDRPEYLSRGKAEEVALRHKDAIIIAADTAVFLGDKMLGKPKTEAEAKEMLCSLSGRVHTVVTGCTLMQGNKQRSFSVQTEVEFYKLTDSEIDDYIKTGESMDKAGAYGIQGRGALLVKGIRGDYFNVVGLPIAELSRQLSAF